MNTPEPVESLGQEGFQQIVLEEMRTFVFEDTLYGRAGYSETVRGHRQSMTIAADAISRYQGRDLHTLQRMVSWMVDVYEQSIGFEVLGKRYPKDSIGEDAIYREAREKIIGTILNLKDEQLDTVHLGALRWLFGVICPESVKPGLIQKISWRRKYGDSGTARDMPLTIDKGDLLNYLRKNLQRIENQR